MLTKGLALRDHGNPFLCQIQPEQPRDRLQTLRRPRGERLAFERPQPPRANVAPQRMEQLVLGQPARGRNLQVALLEEIRLRKAQVHAAQPVQFREQFAHPQPPPQSLSCDRAKKDGQGRIHE